MEIEPRPINNAEALVVSTALHVAPTNPVSEQLLASIDSLVVVDKCGCGCASVDFEKQHENSGNIPIADAIGLTPRGGEVGIIVWGTTFKITGLEIFDLGAGQEDLVLPIPATIHNFQSGAA